MREWKKILMKRIKRAGEQLDHITILNWSEEICPSSQKFGGLLFMYWFYENGKKVNLQCAQKQQQWNSALKHDLMEWDVPRWIMSLYCSMNNISQKNTHQLFYISLVVEWKGLSRTGMDKRGLVWDYK